MEKIIRNRWRAEGSLERARILGMDACPEGLEVERVRALGGARVPLAENAGHLASVLRGTARLGALSLSPGTHLYLPPGAHALDAEPGAELVLVAAPAARAAGAELLVRSERFLAACAAEGVALRWTLTPQYLSRRVFLHHDRTLRSRTDAPVSWFHTTMFDVSGLPPNDEGESVFKMSYNSRTEFNVLYEVTGEARVRFGLHPYAERRFGPWHALDGELTYHLNESPADAEGGLRNRHEVFARAGHVSLLCLFDPAPTGVERHRPGEYSDYEPYELVSARPEHAAHQRQIARFDRMVDRLSRAEAEGRLDAMRGTPEWDTYEEGRAAQGALEAALRAALVAEGRGRERVLEPWASAPPVG